MGSFVLHVKLEHGGPLAPSSLNGNPQPPLRPSMDDANDDDEFTHRFSIAEWVAAERKDKTSERGGQPSFGPSMVAPVI